MSKVKTLIDLGDLKNTCFIVMPFDKLFQTQYEKIIRPTVSSLALDCIRGDEIYTKQRIMDDIWTSIRSCRLVIAELSGKNPNVMYEVGLAHAIGKPVIIITRNGDDVPFDLKALRYLFYDINDPFWGENLKLGLTSLIENVLENQNIDRYLEGINPAKSSKYQYTEKPKTINVESPPTHDIMGIWVGKFNNSVSDHDIIINITQKSNDLIGNATITFYYQDKVTVVQEVFNGYIKENIVTLEGVNFSFIMRGDAKYYGLDRFELIIKNENLIEGKGIDPASAYSIKLQKQTLPNKPSADNAGGIRKLAFTKPKKDKVSKDNNK